MKMCTGKKNELLGKRGTKIMKFGALYSYWGHEWKCDYIETAKKMKKCGCEVLEIGASHLLEMRDEQLRGLKATCDELGMEITSNIGPSKEYDLASEDPAVRANGVKFLADIMKAMKKIGSKSLVGAMYSYWPCTDFKFDEKAGAWDRSIEAMKEVAKVAEDLDVECCLEVLNRFETYILTDCDEAIEYCKRVGSKNVNILLDTFHMNIEEDNLPDAIRKAGELLGHFHVGEGNRKLPGMSKGAMPWAEIGEALREINYNKCVVAEPFLLVGGRVGADIKVWRDLSNGADEEQMDKYLAESIKFLKEKFVE